MKKIIKYLILLLMLLYNSKSKDFELFPLNINLYNIISKNDTVILCGDYGSIFKSVDNGESWNQFRVFDNGRIVNYIYDSNKITAFNDYGIIALSENDGKDWVIKNKFNDSLLAAIKYTNGFLLRFYDSLVTVSNDFKFIQSYPIKSSKLLHVIKMTLSNTMLFFNNQLVVSLDSSKIAVFDKNFKFLNYVVLSDLGFCTYCLGNVQIFSDNDFVFFKGDSTIYKTSDLINFEKVYKFKNPFFEFRKTKNDLLIYEGYAVLKFRIYRVKSSESVDTLFDFDKTKIQSSFIMNDFDIINNKLIHTGNFKTLITGDIETKNVEIKSLFTGLSRFTTPDLVEKDKLLFYKGQFNYSTYSDCEYYKRISTTTNNGITYFPTNIDNENGDGGNIRDYSDFAYKYFNNLTNKLYLFCRFNPLQVSTKDGVFISDNIGKSFEYKEIKDIYFRRSPFIIPNIQIKDNIFITSYYSTDYYTNKYFSVILTFNEQFELTDRVVDSNYIIKYFHVKDTNIILTLANNADTETDVIRFTKDKGKNWEVIKDFEITDSLMYYKEIDYKGNKLLILLYFAKSENIVSFNSLDLERNIYKTFYQYRIYDTNYSLSINNAFDCVNDSVFIAINDTLFITTDLFNRNNWKYIIYPNKGFINRTMKWFGDRLFARYQDNTHDENIYWIYLPEIPDRKPLILVDDYDFGKKDVKDSSYITKTLYLRNDSKETDLSISNFEISNNTDFKTNLPMINQINPLIIKQSNTYEFDVKFKPTQVEKYFDSIVFYSNADGKDNICYLKGEGIDTITKVIEIEINIEPYFYSYPPYPLPAKNEVRALIYWETDYDINTDESEIYNIYGEKIDSKGKISLNKITPYSGYLIWDCSNVEPGIFIIRVKHGTGFNTIKVLVSK
jgi:hypothetical protein